MEFDVEGVAVAAALGRECGLAAVHRAAMHELHVGALVVRLDAEII